MDFIERLREVAQDPDGWDFKVNDDGWYSFNAHSPAGEDLWVEGDLREVKDLREAILAIKADVTREYENFDVDEHIDLYAPGRGKGGVPSSYRTLLEDAEDIEEMLCNLDWFVTNEMFGEEESWS